MDRLQTIAACGASLFSTVSGTLRDVQLHYCEPFGENDEAHDRLIVKRLQKIAVCGAPLLSTVSRKWRDVQLHYCEPFGENCEAHGRIIVNRLQEIAASAQPSRIPKSFMLYDSGIVTGRGLPEVDDFGEVGGAAVEADTLHRYHHQYLGCPRRMLKSTNGGKVLAA